MNESEEILLDSWATIDYKLRRRKREKTKTPLFGVQNITLLFGDSQSNINGK
jgi:hypothetical protein